MSTTTKQPSMSCKVFNCVDREESDVPLHRLPDVVQSLREQYGELIRTPRAGGLQWHTPDGDKILDAQPMYPSAETVARLHSQVFPLDVIGSGYVCTDCVMMIANGETADPDASQERIDWVSKSTAGWCLADDATHPDREFSTEPCAACWCKLHGSRVYAEKLAR